MKTEAKLILGGAFVVILFGLLSYSLLRAPGTDTKATTLVDSSRSAFACTMDAKICPDGSFVGRVAPYCQFAACPAPATPSVAEAD